MYQLLSPQNSEWANRKMMSYISYGLMFNASKIKEKHLLVAISSSQKSKWSSRKMHNYT